MLTPAKTGDEIPPRTMPFDERESIDLVRVQVAREIPAPRSRRELLKAVDFRTQKAKAAAATKMMAQKVTNSNKAKKPMLVDLTGNRKSQRVQFVEA